MITLTTYNCVHIRERERESANPESVDEFVLRCVVIHWNVPLLPASKCYHSNLCVQRIKFQGMKSDKIFNHWNNLSVEDELANALGGIQDKQDVLSD